MQKSRRKYFIIPLLLNLLWLWACASPSATQSTGVLRVCDWVGYDLPEQFAAFEAETRIRIEFVPYGSYTEVVENIRNGDAYDVCVLANEYVGALVQENNLQALDPALLTNIDNLAFNFRDPSYDPQNEHSIPIRWGTTGLLTRDGMVAGQAIKRWSDIWRMLPGQKFAVWPYPREVLALALKSLGYSINSERPSEISQATYALTSLSPHIMWFSTEESTIAKAIIENKALVALAWSYDGLAAQEMDSKITYLLPQEGTFIWGESLVIPLRSLNRAAAHQFINFMLRPENAAAITNKLSYANTNQAANSFIAPQIFNNPIIYPSLIELRNAEVMLPLSANGEALYAQAWRKIINAAPLPSAAPSPETQPPP